MLRQFLQRFAAHINTRPIPFLVISVLAVCLGWYAASSLIPRHIAFDYAGNTCASGLFLFPTIHRPANGSNGFNISFKGGTGILATAICFKPSVAPASGAHAFTVAPWGSSFSQTRYIVDVARAPIVRALPVTTSVAATKPLKYEIDKTDHTYIYRLTADDKQTTCSVDEKKLSCDLRALSLTQGATHDLTLTRSFNDTTVGTVTTSSVNILPAASVVASSMSNGATVYDKVSSIVLTLDKSITKAKATISEVNGSTKTPVDTEITFHDTLVTITPHAQLAREKTFELNLASVEATDGSMLASPYIVGFTTSGGPKVQHVSIGSSVVSPSARITITLDQPIAEKTDITKFAHINGIPAAISFQGSQIVFALSGAPACAAFTLSIDRGLVSAVNDTASKEGWSFTSRIDCGRSATIGYSVKGRPIIAYYYGSGSSYVLFTGGMHGSEPSGYTTMQAWASYLDSNAYQLPANTQVVIIPNTNPDGIAANSRYNANGVNLDRNFATDDWQTDIDTADGHKPGGGGSSPASEPETKALATLTSQLRPRLEVSYHAQGRLVGANQVGNSAALGSAYAKTVGYSTMYGNAEELMGYTITGEYETWIGDKLGLPAILIELPSPSGNYFSSQRSAILTLLAS